MVNICKTVHYALDRIRNPLVMWIGAWWMLDCVGLKMVYGKDKGEGKAHHAATVTFFTGNSDPFVCQITKGTVIQF